MAGTRFAWWVISWLAADHGSESGWGAEDPPLWHAFLRFLYLLRSCSRLSRRWRFKGDSVTLWPLLCLSLSGCLSASQDPKTRGQTEPRHSYFRDLRVNGASMPKSKWPAHASFSHKLAHLTWFFLLSPVTGQPSIRHSHRCHFLLSLRALSDSLPIPYIPKSLNGTQTMCPQTTFPMPLEYMSLYNGLASHPPPPKTTSPCFRVI